MTFDLDAILGKLKPEPVRLTMDGKTYTLRPLTRDELTTLESLGKPAEGETLDQLNVRTLAFVRSLFDVPPPIFPEAFPADPDAARQALLDAAAGMTAVYTIASDQLSNTAGLRRASEEARRQIAERFATVAA